MLEELYKQIQHCCATLRRSRNKRNVGSCWLKSLTGFKPCATTSNNMQQGVKTDATCNIQHCWELFANDVASVCTPCCMLLDVVACCCARFETGQTFQPTTPNISFVPWSPKPSPTMLDPFAQLFQHCWGHARSLCMVYKDLWVVSFPRCTAGPNIVGSCCIRLHATANTHATTPNIVAPTMLGVVAFVCTQPYPAAYTFLSFEIAEVCLPLANWRLYKPHYLIIND